MKTNNEDQSNLAELEAAIERNFGVFYETGQALLKIRDDGLYRGSHNTFVEYCQARWDLKKSQAYRLIVAAQIVENLLTIGNIKKLSPIGDKSLIPATESQARELVGLNPDEQRQVWERELDQVTAQAAPANGKRKRG